MTNNKLYRTVVGGTWLKTKNGGWIHPILPLITRKILKDDILKSEQYPHSFSPQSTSCIGVH
jgi:hypothetical protein